MQKVTIQCESCGTTTENDPEKYFTVELAIFRAPTNEWGKKTVLWCEKCVYGRHQLTIPQMVKE